MEFHISRAARSRYGVDEALFDYIGNVVFADVLASRKLAQRMTEVRQAEDPAADVVNAGSLFAMGLIDELSHALIARYRENIDPDVLPAALQWFTAMATPEQVESLLTAFTTQFPNVAVNRGSVSTRFLAQMQMVRDENTGSGEKPIQVARKNLQILAEGENREGSVVLGFTRILRSETGMYQIDPAYIPPLIDIHAHPTLKRILSNLVELLVARGSQLSGSRRQKNQSLADFTASDIANFWLLYTVNSHLPVLRHFLESTCTLPEMLFNELSDLAGALTAFSNKIAPRDLPAYNHEQLGACFGDLDRLIRIMLETVIPSNFVSLPLKMVRDTIYATSIDKDAYFEGSRFYLAVASDIRDADLIDRSPKLLKCCSATQLETLIRNALPGLRLAHVPTPPRSIPVKLRHQYFAIEQGGPVWESVLRARNFAVYAPSDILNPQMELIILLAQPA